jgi:VWFA-related protein
MHLRQRQHALSAAFFALAAVLYTVAPPARADQKPAYSFQSEVNEVRLAFVATDQHNRDVATLTPADIAVVDDGVVIRRFRSLNRYPQLNLEALLLIDASQSLARQFSREIAEATQLIREARWGPDDALSIMSFGGLEPSLVCLRNCRDLPPAAWISKIHTQGQTPLFDAVVQGVEFVAKDRGSNCRPVLIILSDGDDTISKHSFADAVVSAIRAEVPIYTLHTGGLKNIAGGNVLRELAALTGGFSFSRTPGASSDLASVVEDLRNAYVLTYDLPSHAEGLHSVSVLPTTNSKLRIRSRRAYFYTRTHASAQKGVK